MYGGVCSSLFPLKNGLMGEKSRVCIGQTGPPFQDVGNTAVMASSFGKGQPILGVSVSIVMIYIYIFHFS